MKNELLRMVEKRKMGIHCGIPSFCSANKYVIETAIEQAQRQDDFVVIEATSNQVNQYGGYMGMRSVDFKNYVYKIADQLHFDRNKIILGGDHLGPLPWCDEPAEIAMEKAKKLVHECVKAGYLKIHLDTSMRLGSDDVTQRLSDDIIAERGVELYCEAIKAYDELLIENPNAIRPVFVIGSEVPIPGGMQAHSNDMEVTRAEDFENTLLAYRKAFSRHGMENAQKDIIAIVVQPGVEFGETHIHQYDRYAARKLCSKLQQYPDIVFEGHSTDYQPYEKLRQMVEDGIAIIKVGPALTYAVREALFALSMMEDELISESRKSNFRNVLEKVMLENDKDWKKYYKGTDLEKHLLREYSFSDRSRYYFNNKEVIGAINTLVANLDEVGIPMYMLHQYMPLQYMHVRDGKVKCEAKELIKDAVRFIVENYNYAVKMNYMMETINL